jgi:hypothetical protein
MRDAQDLQVGYRRVSLIQDTVIEEHDLPQRRDQNGSITLPDVHVVDLELAVRLREGRERYEDAKECEQESPHRPS